jgi:hypothetical protein
MSDNTILFEEKQYLGFNKYSNYRRLAMALFCFAAYYFTAQRKQNGELFLLLAVSILVISLLLLFVMHIHTKVQNGSLVLDGIWSTRKVKIDLKSIVSVEKTNYNKFYFNSPVYNLHLKQTIRFYTRGNQSVKLIDKDGLSYIIGSQKAEELYNTIQQIIKS